MSSVVLLCLEDKISFAKLFTLPMESAVIVSYILFNIHLINWIILRNIELCEVPISRYVQVLYMIDFYSEKKRKLIWVSYKVFIVDWYKPKLNFLQTFGQSSNIRLHWNTITSSRDKTWRRMTRNGSPFLHFFMHFCKIHTTVISTQTV
jgi:hypothetical protein